MYTTLYFNFGIYYSMFNTKSQFLSFTFTHFVLLTPFLSGKHSVSKCVFLFSLFILEKGTEVDFC